MKKLLNVLQKNWPLIFLVGLEILLFATNYTPNTYLSGWDNSHPELNLLVNFKRSIFSVWQEYRGLGLLDGMSYAAKLPHTLAIFILSFIFPTDMLRYIFIFMMHLLGGLGVYFLSQSLLEKNKFKQLLSFIGSLFYLYNIGTVQMFFTPLEAFSFHFAFLPWLIYVIRKFLISGSKKDFTWFAFVSIVSIPQAHVPTFFIVYLFAFLSLIIFHRNLTRIIEIKKILLLIILTFMLNSFWGLPYLYSAIHNAKTIADSKINQMSTEDTYLKNREYGDLSDVVLMKGFSLNTVDWQGKTFNYMMLKWKNHAEKQSFMIIGTTFFVLALLGLFKIIICRKRKVYPFVLLFVFSFLMLGTDTPILNVFSGFFYTSIPFFFQIFRSAFTKFSILYFFSFSILLSFGLSVVFDKLFKLRYFNKFLIFTFFFLFGYYSLPYWQGEFLYKNLKVSIPQDYFNLIEFFKKQNNNQRIATLPQPSFWGWTYTNWGYRGSGFIWYGLPQTTLDGAFYPWSKENENYYWELTNAVYSDDAELFNQILQKYQINWIVVDEGIINISYKKILDLDRLNEMIAKSDHIKFSKSLGNIKIYEVNLNSNPKDFIYLQKDLPVIGPEYKWNNYDKAYLDNGNYITDNKQQTTDNKEEKLSGGFGGFFRTGHCKECYDDPEQKDNYNAQKESDIKSVIHKLFNLAALLDSKILNNHAANIPTIPNTTIDQSNLSTPVIIGDSTTTPKITWPALSKILAKRNNSSVENTGFVGNGGLIKTIYAKNSTEDNKLSIPDIYYPFRSLFTGRQQNELEFNVEDKGDYFSFTSQIPTNLSGNQLIIPQIYPKEITELNQDDLSKTTTKTIQIYLDGELVKDEIGQDASESSVLLSNIKEGLLEIRVPKIKGSYSYDFLPSSLNQQPKSCDVFNDNVKKLEQISENSFEFLRMTSIGSNNCLDFKLSFLPQNIEYLVSIENRYREGKSLLFWVINQNSQSVDINTYLPKNKEFNRSYFIIPSMGQYGLGYTLHLDNISMGRVKTVNDLGRITVNPIPYRFLTSLKIVKDSYDSSTIGGVRASQVQLATPEVSYRVDHPNPSLYQVSLGFSTLSQSDNTTLVLSQSYDEGWKAYLINKEQITNNNFLIRYFPFFFGQEIKDHVLVNNWENGWQIGNLSLADSRLQENNLPKTKDQSPMTIIIVYLPQYLEYVGFILFGGGILFVIYYPKTKSNQQSAINNS